MGITSIHQIEPRIHSFLGMVNKVIKIPKDHGITRVGVLEVEELVVNTRHTRVTIQDRDLTGSGIKF